MQIEITEVLFEIVYPIWKNYLWPERQSVIEDISLINLQGQIDGSIQDLKPIPRFFCIKNKDQICAVTSLHETAKDEYRLRGTWVSDKERGRGLGKNFIHQVIERYVSGGSRVWTMSRANNVSFYSKIGFQVRQQIEQYEYGPHYIMVYTK